MNGISVPSGEAKENISCRLLLHEYQNSATKFSVLNQSTIMSDTMSKEATKFIYSSRLLAL